MEYRIKEVNIQPDVEKLIFYFPQQKLRETITTGMLWWKKTVTQEKWCYIYREDNSPVWCPTLPAAHKFLEDYKKMVLADLQKKHVQWATDVEEEYVKYH